KLTVQKTVPNDLDTGEKYQDTFSVTGASDATNTRNVTLTFLPGDTTKSVDVTGLVPDTYIVKETSNVWYPSDYPTHPSITGLLSPQRGDTQNVSLGAGANGLVANCSGTASFTNILAQGVAHAQVQKIT